MKASNSTGFIACRAAILAVWLCLVAWLIRYEAFPERFTRTLAGYQSVISRDIPVRDSWMRVLFNGAAIGYTHSNVDVNEFDSVRHHLVRSRLHLRFRLLGQLQHVRADSTVYLDAAMKLSEVSFSVSAPPVNVTMSAERLEGDRFEVLLTTGASPRRMTVEIPPDVIVNSPLMETTLRSMRPGQAINVRTLDPMTMERATLRVRALTRETLVLGGTPHEATVLSTEYRGMSIRSWIGRDGHVLRQETPFGWTMEACTAQEAVDAMDHSADAADVLQSLPFPLNLSPATPPGEEHDD